MNNIQITARLTADPQQRMVGELQITDLRVAIPRRKGSGGEDRGAVFIDVTTFGPLAGVCGKYLSKGRRVAVDGRLELDEWTKDGSPRRRHKIIAEQIEFLDYAAPGDNDAVQADDEPADEVAAQRARHTEDAEPVPAAA
jgi:single-strand DNA-binding protein